MSNKELLEMAAKAAGIKIDKSTTNGGGAGNTGFDVMGNAVLDWHNYKAWNPLTNDGDALRLAVKLEIDLSFYTEREAKVYAQTKHLLGYGADDSPSYQAHEYHKELYKGSSPSAAVRLAIVKAAAAIGRKK